MFGALKRAMKGASREVAAELGQNKDFLEAVCAGAARIAAADGEIEDAEKKEIPRLVAADPTLGKLYQRDVIERTMETMLASAMSVSGKLRLQRELEDLRGKPNAAAMSETVVAVCIDIAMADGEMEEPEKKELAKIAGWLGVDLKKFEF